MNTLRLADIIGTISATACITLTFPELAENIGLLTLLGYTFGVVVITNKINGVFRGE